jgi:hypothetical protein
MVPENQSFALLQKADADFLYTLRGKGQTKKMYYLLLSARIL